MSDSDTSDLEYDLSVEKQLENFKNSYRLDNQNNNDYYNNRNSKNNNTDNEGNQNHINDNSNFNRNSNNTHGITNLCRVEALLKNALESPSTELPPPMDDGEDDVDFLLMENEKHTEQVAVIEQSNDQTLSKSEHVKTPTDKYVHENHTEIIACDLQTYLKRYNERSGYINFNKKPLIKKSPTSPNEPPDILAKSVDNLTLDTVSVKPDILQMIDSTDGNQNYTENMLCYDFEQKSCSRDNNSRDQTVTQITEKDDHGQWGITPVDIVGNFEQEVQREFGLLMSGYKNSTSSNEQSSLRAAEINDYISSNIHEKVIPLVYYIFFILK